MTKKDNNEKLKLLNIRLNNCLDLASRLRRVDNFTPPGEMHDSYIRSSMYLYQDEADRIKKEIESLEK